MSPLPPPSPLEVVSLQHMQIMFLLGETTVQNRRPASCKTRLPRYAVLPGVVKLLCSLGASADSTGDSIPRQCNARSEVCICRPWQPADLGICILEARCGERNRERLYLKPTVTPVPVRVETDLLLGGGQAPTLPLSCSALGWYEGSLVVIIMRLIILCW